MAADVSSAPERRASCVAGGVPDRLSIALAALVLGALLVQQVMAIGDFRVDDAYISFSFSKNFAAGNGLVYSHELRVEGYSNFLWVLLVALGYLVAPNLDPYVPGRVFAFAFLALGLFATYRLARLRAPRWAGFLALGLLLASSDVIRGTLSALETVPFMSAIALGWYVYLNEPPTARRWSLVAFLPAALLRIDGFVPMLVLIGFELASAIASRRFRPAVFARWLALPVLVWAVYFAWRWWYYGLPLPTTYYAKSLVTANEALRGWNQIWSFLRDYGLLALLPFQLLPLVRGPRRPALALWAAVLAHLIYAGMVGGDWMPFHRFLMPIFPLGAVLAAWGAARFIEELRWYRADVRAAGVALGSFAFGWVGVHMHMSSVDSAEEREKLSIARHVFRHTRDLVAAMDLARYVVRKPGDELVTDYAGVFAVFTDATVIDMWGLCNEEIALHGNVEDINPIYGKTCVSCYARIQPDYFHVGVPLVRRGSEYRSRRQLVNDIFQGNALDRVLDFGQNYAVGRVVEKASGRTFWFLERRRPGVSFVERRPASGIRVDYPFETG